MLIGEALRFFEETEGTGGQVHRSFVFGFCPSTCQLSGSYPVQDPLTSAVSGASSRSLGGRTSLGGTDATCQSPTASIRQLE